MTKNAGNTDRIVRILMGFAVLTQVFIGVQTPWAYLGLVLVATGLMGYCPLYPLFGISTCPINNPKRKN